MGVFDDLKNKVASYRENAAAHANNDDDQLYEEDYDQDFEGSYDEEGYASDPSYRGSYPASSDAYYDEDNYDTNNSVGMLGQTPRGEAQSVSVISRSGVRLDNDRNDYPDRYAASPSAIGYAAPYGEPVSSYRPGAYDTPSSVQERRSQQNTASTSASSFEPRSSSVISSAQLPAYILKPESYDDVETVVRRVKTRQPVALVFINVKTDVAMRVLDFSFGFACGCGAHVEELGDRVFMVLPYGCEVKESDLSKLRAEGYLKH